MFKATLLVPLKPIQYGCMKEGQISLTFDGCPNSVTRDLLTNLQQQAWQVTFFVPGNLTQEEGKIIDEACKQNHVIGLLFPADVDPTKLNNNDLVGRLRSDSSKIYNHIKKWPKFLRFPKNNYDQRVYEVASSLGLTIVEWNLEALDCKPDVTADEIAQAYRAKFISINRGSGRFIASHRSQFTIWRNAALLMTLSNEFMKNGYPKAPVSLPDCLNTTTPYRPDNKDYRCYMQSCDSDGNLYLPFGSATTSDSASSHMTGQLMYLTVWLMLFCYMIY